ncbi:MAG TPA: FHA domain-containing protein [Isosphaeraceae bacterium]|jgi:hypothetical protein|nr:FHA domain-containing protein [Isosphaeraceae bacterium]
MKTSCPKSFAEACGASGSLCLQAQHRIEGNPAGKVLPQPFALIGSEAKSDFILSHPDVRRRHAYLQVIDGQVFGIDLSHPSAQLPAPRHVAAGWLGTEQAMKIGPFDLTPSLVAGPGHASEEDSVHQGSPLSSTYVARPGLPEVTLIFLNKDERGQTWRMNRVFAILGQSADCKVQLISSSVSTYHCSLLRTPLGVWVVDLLGRRGIKVNGSPVRFARLKNGDFLQVGDFMIGIQCEASVPDLSLGIAKEPAGRDVQESPQPAQKLGAVRGLPQSRGPLPARPAPSATNGHRSPRPAIVNGPVNHALKRIEPKPSPASNGSRTDLDKAPPPSTSTPEVLKPLDPSSAMLFEQLGLMQQQMFEQFDRILTGMFQMLSTLHKDQVQMIRDEVNQIRELTRELYDLKAEQAKSAPAPLGPFAPGTAGIPPWGPLDPTGRMTRNFRLPEFDPPSVGQFTPKPFSSTSAKQSASIPAGSRVLESQSRFPEEKRPTEEPLELRAKPTSSSQTSEDVHDLLSRRISELQEEQQGRLQKLFGLLTRR